MVSNKMRLAVAPLILVSSWIGLSSAAQAATVFSTDLLPGNENPPVTSAGVGLGQLTLADVMNSFSVLINFSGLGSNAVAGHVHCCSAIGLNAPVAIGFSVPGATFGTIMGTYEHWYQHTRVRF